ncbi:uncharacterized protein LOC106715768 [Papilio machaon]|uniref:uncharacterized protein LOC106715768 n=1 Tax=Papilio machaon TaxID=76193 RepID=UPI001E66420F|nr:uncharacterized protein LOC106715768 [Papilio machaon]XP_014364616.2 uncharacterized protein LOC106715768 [Papilio machaon]
MSSVNERLAKLREERKAREEERIRKLRELNLKKYNSFDLNSDSVTKNGVSNSVKNKPRVLSAARGSFSSLASKPSTSKDVASNSRQEALNIKRQKSTEIKPKNSTSNGNHVETKHILQKANSNFERSVSKSFDYSSAATKNLSDLNKSNVHIKNTNARLSTVPRPIKKPAVYNNGPSTSKTEVTAAPTQSNNAVESKDNSHDKCTESEQPSNKPNGGKPELVENIADNLPHTSNSTEQSADTKTSITNTNKAAQLNTNHRRTLAPISVKPRVALKLFTTSKPDNRKSLPAFKTKDVKKFSPRQETVFERLYKPKTVTKHVVDDAQRLRTDPSYLKKVIEESQLTTGMKRPIPQAKPIRRSISAVHLRRISKSEQAKCIQNWASVGEKLDKVNVNEIDEDDCINYVKVVSAVKSERKKVKFMTPVTMKYNTPSTEELQSRLQKWLQKRGKSMDSYHHLQCFGIRHLSKKPLELPSLPLFDDEDENKENVAVEMDSDNQSYTDNLNHHDNDFPKEDKEDFGKDQWRSASFVSESVSLNDINDVTMTPSVDFNHLDVLLHGALTDLTELLREGFEWGQCACWLRSIRGRFPAVTQTAAYWECRAALEERRGDLPASMQCWEEAIVMGTERSVVEENLDQLLDKFMQLKISPSNRHEPKVDPKMVDVKNVLKSTIIRFAVHKAKIRNSTNPEPAKYTVTPVRRSARLSMHYGSARRTPLQECSTVSQASKLGHPVVFVPNDQLNGTP